MNELDPTKRRFLKAACVSIVTVTSGSVSFPKKAEAFTPFAASLILTIAPSMVSSITGLIQSNQAAHLEHEKLELQARLQEASLRDGVIREELSNVNNWLFMGVQSGQLSYQVAVDAYSRSLTNMHLSNNLYGSNTYAAVKDGAMYLERAGVGGKMHAASTSLTKDYYKKNGELLVPVDYPREIGNEEETKAIDSIAKSLRMDGSVFNKTYTLGSRRGFSAANNPTKGNSNVALYAAFNREQEKNGQAVAQFFATGTG